MIRLDSLRALYIYELNDLQDAETQLEKALPKMASAASSANLRLAFEKHFKETKEHMRRLEQAFALLKEKPAGVSCKAMKGLLEEGDEMNKAVGHRTIKDAGLISMAQRIAHYQIASYGCARTYAAMLSDDASAELLQETLDEERATDQSLTELSEQLLHPEPALA